MVMLKSPYSTNISNRESLLPRPFAIAHRHLRVLRPPHP